MLRQLSIRDFVIVSAEELEFCRGFTTLTGETGAGKSILLDALGLLLGERGEAGLIRRGAERAELSAVFELDDAPRARAWLAAQELDDAAELVLRRVLDGQGRSRAWVNGRPATLQQLREVGEMLVDIHGQHAHQSLSRTEVQRELLDGFGGLEPRAEAVALAWRARREARERLARARAEAGRIEAEAALLRERLAELEALKTEPQEWANLSAQQTRLAHASSLIETAGAAQELLSGGEDSLSRGLAQLLSRLNAALAHDAALRPMVELIEGGRIQLEEAAHALRAYRQRLDLDPAELARVESRLSAMHELARKHRVRPEELCDLRLATAERLAALEAAADLPAQEREAVAAEVSYRQLAEVLGQGRAQAATELSRRVSLAMQNLALAGAALEVALVPREEGTSCGLEDIEFRFRAHPQQPAGPLSRVASGGELSRLSLAIQVVTSEVAQVPTLVFDEVDAGIGGGVAVTVGRLLQELGARRQVLCVTHLPQVAACADEQWQVSKAADGGGMATRLQRLAVAERVEELARMLGGAQITGKTRAHARELFESSRR
ncbi:DNA repair protein RecN [Burkholderiales bacterium]|nr:MAG: DNA repair protein RecN [Burkholderiales bacterium]CAG0999451.1 DNA repair protein RecN [Burkholderiales bacterium]